MSEAIKNNTPAFPYTIPAAGGDGPIVVFGMTMRDYFAAKAMQGLIESDRNWDAAKFSKAAYSIADSMMEARKL